MSVFDPSERDAAATACLVAALRRGLDLDGAAAPHAPPEVIRRAAEISLRTKTLGPFLQGIRGTAAEAEQAWLTEVETGYSSYTFRKNAVLLTSIRQIAEILSAEGLGFATYKGPWQQNQLYGSMFTRPSADLDLLVSRRDFVAAARALERRGFVIHYNLAHWWRIFVGQDHLRPDPPADWSVDLHHRLQEPGMQQPVASHLFLRDTETLTLQGQEVHILAARFIPLISTMNLVKGLSRRLDSMADVAHKIPASHVMDLFHALDHGAPDKVAGFLDLARRHGLEGSALLGLRTLGAVFGVRFPAQEAALSGLLPEVDDLRLTRMVFAPGLVQDWPRPSAVLRESWAGAPLGLARDFAWYAASEASRKLAKAGHMMRRAET
jgi:hypothetical protein